jgi:parallel beta-helix repeat protein
MQKHAAGLKVRKKSTYLWVLFAVCILTLTVPPAGSLASRSHESDDQNVLIWQDSSMPVQRSAPLAERPIFELLRSSLRQRSRLEATVSPSGFHGSSPGRSLRATQQQALPTRSTLAIPGLTPHDPIVILSDSDFAAQGWPGSGTPGDPYRIEHLAIDLNGTDGHCIEIQSTSAHFVVFNCTLTEATGLGYSGICLNDVQNGRLEANNITGNDIGILLGNSSLNNILNNAISNHGRAGVYFDESSDNTIRTNNVTTSWSGLYLEWSTSNVLNNNYCYDNEFGIDVYGASTNNSIVNNTCVSNNYGIYLSFAAENDIIENNCSQNNLGIHVLESNSNSIDINTCNDNVYG